MNIMRTHQTYQTLISVAEVLDGTRPVVVLDCRFDLGAPQAGEAAYAEAHIAGAHYAHLERDLSGARNGRNGRHPLPVRDDFAARLGGWGITPATQVIAYDAHDGMIAARAWWLLRWMGHTTVAVLDGGFAAWLAARGALGTGEDTLVGTAKAYPASVEPAMPTIDADTLLGLIGRVRVLDARSAERFRGDVEPIDAVAGHIPGATSRFFKDNLQSDGFFKPAAQLRVEFDALATAPVDIVHQCGSGVTACHNLLAMSHAGLTGSVLYPGSWSEWSADPARPVATGG